MIMDRNMKTFRDLKVGDVCWERNYFDFPTPIILKEIKTRDKDTKFRFDKNSLFLENDDLDETRIYDDNEDTYIPTTK